MDCFKDILKDRKWQKFKFFLNRFKGIQLDEIQGLRKKTETELKLTTTPLNATSKNINTSWNKDVKFSFIYFLTVLCAFSTFIVIAA